MAIKTITRAEFALYKQQIEEQISVISSQLQLLRTDATEPIPEVEIHREEVNAQIDQIQAQLALLRNQPRELTIDNRVDALAVQFGDWIQQIEGQIAALRAQLQDEDQLGILPRFAILQAEIDDRFGNVNAQLGALRQQGVTIAADNRIEVVQSDFDTKIQSIAQQIANIRVDQQVQVDQSTEVFKEFVNEQIRNLIQQINVLNQKLELFEETVIEGDIVITEELLQEIENIVNNIITDITIEDGTNKGVFTLSITAPGDTWTGTEVNPLFDPNMVIVPQVHINNLTTRIAGRLTDFFINITNVDNNSFDWEIESTGLVYDGELEVRYLWKA